MLKLLNKMELMKLTMAFFLVPRTWQTHESSPSWCHRKTFMTLRAKMRACARAREARQGEARSDIVATARTLRCFIYNRFSTVNSCGYTCLHSCPFPTSLVPPFTLAFAELHPRPRALFSYDVGRAFADVRRRA